VLVDGVFLRIERMRGISESIQKCENLTLLFGYLDYIVSSSIWV
jgi:hypothetical protein